MSSISTRQINLSSDFFSHDLLWRSAAPVCVAKGRAPLQLFLKEKIPHGGSISLIPYSRDGKETDVFTPKRTETKKRLPVGREWRDQNRNLLRPGPHETDQTQQGKTKQGKCSSWRCCPLVILVKLMREYERDLGIWNESYDISLRTCLETTGK